MFPRLASQALSLSPSTSLSPFSISCDLDLTTTSHLICDLSVRPSLRTHSVHKMNPLFMRGDQEDGAVLMKATTS